MKNKMLLSLLFLWLALPSRGQDAILYHVYYDLNHVHTQSMPTDTLRQNMLLAVGANSTHFASYNKLTYGYQSAKTVENTPVTVVDGKLPSIRLSPERYFVPEHYLFYEQQKHLVLDYFLRPYWYEAGFPKMAWQLEDEWKEILGMNCQKATTTFGGRDWEAWFSPDVPLPVGPWMLHGLPGLIVEARDSTGDVRFAATAIIPHAEEDEDEVLAIYVGDSIMPPTDIAEEIKESDLKQLKQAARTNFQGFMASQSNEPMLSGPRDYFNFLGVRQVHENNPINLESERL